MLIHENAFENVVCEMAAILSRRQCVKWYWTYAMELFHICQAPPYYISADCDVFLNGTTVNCSDRTTRQNYIHNYIDWQLVGTKSVPARQPLWVVNI